ENLAECLVRTRLVAIVRIGETCRWIERHERSYLRRISNAGDDSNLLRITQGTVIDKKLRQPTRHESEGRIEEERLEQRAVIEVGALPDWHAVEIAAAKRVRQPLRQDRRT